MSVTNLIEQRRRSSYCTDLKNCYIKFYVYIMSVKCIRGPTFRFVISDGSLHPIKVLKPPDMQKFIICFVTSPLLWGYFVVHIRTNLIVYEQNEKKRK